MREKTQVSLDDRARRALEQQDNEFLERGRRNWEAAVQRAREHTAEIFGEEPVGVGDMRIPASEWRYRGFRRESDPLAQTPGTLTLEVRHGPGMDGIPWDTPQIYVRLGKYLFEYREQCSHSHRLEPGNYSQPCYNLLGWRYPDRFKVAFLTRTGCIRTLAGLGMLQTLKGGR